MFQGGSPMARMWELTWAQVLGPHGASPELIATARTELQDEKRWFYAPPTVRASARAPRSLILRQLAALARLARLAVDWLAWTRP